VVVAALLRELAGAVSQWGRSCCRWASAVTGWLASLPGCVAVAARAVIRAVPALVGVGASLGRLLSGLVAFVALLSSAASAVSGASRCVLSSAFASASQTSVRRVVNSVVQVSAMVGHKLVGVLVAGAGFVLVAGLAVAVCLLFGVGGAAFDGTGVLEGMVLLESHVGPVVLVSGVVDGGAGGVVGLAGVGACDGALAVLRCDGAGGVGDLAGMAGVGLQASGQVGQEATAGFAGDGAGRLCTGGALDLRGCLAGSGADLAGVCHLLAGGVDRAGG
jgi:hypothetical protein